MFENTLDLEERQDYYAWDFDQKTTGTWEKEDYLWGSEYLWGLYCPIPYFNPFRNRTFGVGTIMV